MYSFLLNRDRCAFTVDFVKTCRLKYDLEKFLCNHIPRRVTTDNSSLYNLPTSVTSATKKCNDLSLNS